MKLDPVVLPDYYSGGKPIDLYVHHFKTDKPQVRHHIALKQNLVCILLKGTKEVFGSHQSIRIDNREILLMSSGSTIMMHSVAEGSHKLESLLIFFSDRILREVCVKHKLDFSGEAEKAPPVLNLKKDDFLLNFESSLKLLEGDDFTTLQKIKLEELLVYLALTNRAGSFHAFVQNALGNAGKEKFRQVVDGNCHNGLTIEELAFLCDMSASTFKRHFVKVFKCSPKKYLTDKKMERARELLLLDCRPSDIYIDLRYQSLSSFSTEFKKYFGVSPKRFQQKSVGVQ
jgi:AraC family transcriptional regulator, exoenzyme S synthesis regulatory protein ExsA